MANTKGNLTHDCAIEDINGVVTGLTLAHDATGWNKGFPAYAEMGDPALAQQYFSGAADYSYSPPEKRLPILIDDWRAGFGLKIYDYDEPSRYYKSFGIDARFRNGLMPGPLPTAIAKPTASAVARYINILDCDFEYGTSTWTKSAGVTSTGRTTEDKYQGTYGFKITANSGTNSGNTYYYLDIDSSDWAAGQAYTFTAYYKAVTTYYQRIGIDDGVGTTYSANGTETSWTQISVSRTLDASATRLRLILHANENSAVNTDGYFDTLTLKCTSSTDYTVGVGYDSCEFNSEQYFAFGHLLTKLNATGDGWTHVAAFSRDITALKAFGDYLYIGQGDGYGYFYMDTSETIAQWYQPATFFVVNNVTLWKGTTPNILNSSTATLATPAAPAWSGDTAVGGSDYNIEELNTETGTVYIHKEEGTYYIDADGNPQPLDDTMRTEYASDSGKNSYVWHGAIYIPCGTQTLYEWDGSNLNVISPALFTTGDTDFDGQIQGIAGDAHYLYIVVDNSTKVEILAGRYETIGSSTAWRWHPIAEITLTGCEKAFITSIYKKRLYITSTSASDDVYYITLPTQYGSVETDSNLTFKSGGYLEACWLHGRFKGDTKAWRKVTLIMSNTDATNYWTIYYKKWGDASWTKIDDFGDGSETIQSAYIPVDGSGNKCQSEFLQLKVACTSDGAATAPVLPSIFLEGILYNPKRRMIAMSVKVADNLPIKNGIDTQTASEIKSALDGAIWPTTEYPITFYPPYWKSSTDTIYIKFLPEQCKFYPRVIDKMKGIEWIYDLVAIEEPIS